MLRACWISIFHCSFIRCDMTNLRKSMTVITRSERTVDMVPKEILKPRNGNIVLMWI